MVSSGSAVQDPGNAFNALRMLAASAVIFSHHFHIVRVQPPAWLYSGMVGGVAVMTFLPSAATW